MMTHTKLREIIRQLNMIINEIGEVDNDEFEEETQKIQEVINSLENKY